jgi:shikimate dehydrogenase
MAENSTILLLGSTVSSSLSPGFQQAAFMALGIDCRYVARDVPAAGLAAVIDEIRADASILGANVTIPHKEAVIPLLDELDPLARKVGAVNTISRHGARLKGWNTDVAGFRRALAEQSPSHKASNSLPRLRGRVGWGPSPARGEQEPSPASGGGQGGGNRVAIIGAGGAARAVAVALQPTAEIWVVARNLEQARRLCHDLDIDRGGPVDMSQMRETVAAVDLVVNATPADLPPASWLRPEQRVFDLRSRRSAEGRAMLLYQGAASFEIWTGRPAPLLVMRTTLERSAALVRG